MKFTFPCLALLLGFCLLAACGTAASPSPGPAASGEGTPDTPALRVLFDDRSGQMEPVSLAQGEVFLGWTLDLLEAEWDSGGALVLLNARFSGQAQASGGVQRIIDPLEGELLIMMISHDDGKAFPYPQEASRAIWVRLWDPGGLLPPIPTGRENHLNCRLLLEDYAIQVEGVHTVVTATVAGVLETGQTAAPEPPGEASPAEEEYAPPRVEGIEKSERMRFTNHAGTLEPVELGVGDEILGWTATHMYGEMVRYGNGVEQLLRMEAAFTGRATVRGTLLPEVDILGYGPFFLVDKEDVDLFPYPVGDTRSVWFLLEDPEGLHLAYLEEDAEAYAGCEIVVDGYIIHAAPSATTNVAGLHGIISIGRGTVAPGTVAP